MPQSSFARLEDYTKHYHPIIVGGDNFIFHTTTSAAVRASTCWFVKEEFDKN
eukprot:Awhi_evm1s7948